MVWRNKSENNRDVWIAPGSSRWLGRRVVVSTGRLDLDDELFILVWSFRAASAGVPCREVAAGDGGEL